MRGEGSCHVITFYITFVVLLKHDTIINIYLCVCCLSCTQRAHHKSTFGIHCGPSDGSPRPARARHSAGWQLAKPYKAILSCCRRSPANPFRGIQMRLGVVWAAWAAQHLFEHLLMLKLTILAEFSSMLSFQPFL